jgi:hypothetical protein
MPQKRKASAARVANLQVARDTLSGKRRKSTTPVDSDFSDEKTSDDDVWINCFKKSPKLLL